MGAMDDVQVELRKAGKVMRRWLIIAAVVAVVAGAAYTWFTLSWSYSEGERAGLLQKFGRKGWLCKTYEGELAQYIVGGVAPQIWYFSVRDEATAEQLRKAVGEKVQLHYTQHRGVPSSCFAETEYFVDGVNAATDQAPKP
jgi:hypothetical protein